MPADTKQKGTLISKSVTVDTIHIEYWLEGQLGGGVTC